jgi:protein O-mannosyl-transferase
MAKKQQKKPVKEVKHKRALFPYVVLPLLALVLYANTFNHGYTMDDDVYITQHRSVQKGFKGIGEIFSHGSLYGFNQVSGTQPYRPVYLLTYALEKEIGKNTAGARHVVNVLLFALLSVVLYRLLVLMLGEQRYVMAFFATALFVVHPVHTEVVASIKSRDEILCLLFAALSLISLLHYNRKGKGKSLFAACVFFFLSMLSKENGITIAAIAPLTLFFFTDTKLPKAVMQSLPFFGLVIVYMLIRNSMMSGPGDGSEKMIINNVLNGAHNLNERYATNFVILGKYLQLLFIPYPLAYDYSFNQIPVTSWASPEAMISLLLYLGLAVYAVMGFRKKNIFSYCILFYFITLSVVSNLLFMTGSTMAERFLFMPSLGFCVAITVLLARVLKSPEAVMSITKVKPTYTLTILGVAIVFSILTVNANKAWKNNFELFKQGVKGSPNSARTHGSLAYEYKLHALKEQSPTTRTDYFNKSVQEFRKAADILPGYEYALYNLGVGYYEMGDEENALKTYLETLAYSPNHINANNNAGVIYFNRKQYDSALVHFQKAYKADPNNSNAIGNIGAIYHNKGDLKNAKEYYEKALAISPNRNIFLNLSKVCYALRDEEKGKYYEKRAGEMQ